MIDIDTIESSIAYGGEVWRVEEEGLLTNKKIYLSQNITPPLTYSSSSNTSQE